MEIKKSEEILAEVHRNCQLALQSIADILPETDDNELREELMRQHEEYERIGGRAATIARDKNIELKDDSRAHIAEMMVQGTVMGITALKSTLSEMSGEADPDIEELVKDLLSFEERAEKIWKSKIA